MTNESGTPPTPATSFNDFLDAWRKAAADTEQRWNDFFNELMGTDAFAQVMARSMDGYLTMQATFAKGMEQYLRALNLPTRTDVNQLAERVALLEQKIDLIAASLGAAAPAAAEPNASGGAPRRGRKRGGGGRSQS